MQANDLFSALYQSLAWQQDRIKVYGKWHNIPRLQAWYGDSQQAYQYSGLTMVAQPWTESLLTIKHRIEQFSQVQFNSCLVNLYRDGNDTVGWHSDDEPELGQQPIIASLSLGDSRDFKMKHKTLDKKLTITLDNGSLLLMSGDTQHYWQHCLPRTKRVKSPRVNLTFRQIQG